MRGQPTTKYEYDDAGRLEKTIANMAYPDVYTRNVYDDVGNLTSVRDEVGDTTVFQYDDMDRVEKITDAENGVTKFGFDEAGNVKWQNVAQRRSD